MKLHSLFSLTLAGTAAARAALSGPAPLAAALHLAPRQAEPTTYPAHTIDQPIDHFPHSDRYRPHPNGTFKQRYYFDSSYYQPGGPVFLYIGGETSGPSRFGNLETGIIQILMQEFHGLGVILENRYYGESYPYNDSTVDHLAFLTTEQTIADNAYFAKHATFPGVQGNLTAPHTPWILYGGSLAGAQTAFSVVTYGKDLLYGGICSSGLTHPELGYPDWYNPIQELAPQDCVSRINFIVDSFDHLVATNNTAAVNKFKSLFGLESVKDNRDFAMTISFPIGNPMNYPTETWQELNWDPNQGYRDFFYFCGNVTDDTLPKNVTDVDYALAEYTNGKPWTGLGAYAKYVQEILLPMCPDADYDSTTTGCFGTQNQTYWADPTSSASRSYLYSTCTEQGAYQVAPAHGPSLISRVLQVDYTQQWCIWAFPPGRYNSIPATPNLTYYSRYGDFHISAPRLALIDGSADVWRGVGYHAPAAGLRTGPQQYLINGGGHHWDSYGILDVQAEPQFIREAHLWELRTVQRWLAAFPRWKPGKGARDEL